MFKMQGKGEICTYHGVINSSEDIYETYPQCRGKGTIYEGDEIFNLECFPQYNYYKNKCATLQQDISEILNKITSII